MSNTIITNKIKPISGKTVEIDGDLVVNDIQITNSSAKSGSAIPLPAGSIMPSAGRIIPDGFLLCDGRAVSRSEYANLFNAIGDDWGKGNESTTFNIPDLRGAFLRGTNFHGNIKKANSKSFAGPRLGNYEEDCMQASRRYIDISDRGYPTSSGDRTSDYYLMHPSRGLDYRLESPRYADGANGAPREGDETRPFNAGVNYLIKI